jgi:hypothetical protein
MSALECAELHSSVADYHIVILNEELAARSRDDVIIGIRARSCCL